MNKKLFLLVFFLFLFFLSARAVSAQSFSFTTPSATQSAGVEFKVTVGIEVGTAKTIGADLKITYDPTLLEVVETERGDFFSRGGLNSTSGQLYLSYGIETSGTAKSGSGTYAVLTLKGKKAGDAVLTVACSNQSADSNIWDEASKDIIACSKITDPHYVIGGTAITSTPTLAPTASASGLITATPVPPVSGIIGPTFFALGAGLLLIFIGLAFLF